MGRIASATTKEFDPMHNRRDYVVAELISGWVVMRHDPTTQYILARRKRRKNRADEFEKLAFFQLAVNLTFEINRRSHLRKFYQISSMDTDQLDQVVAELVARFGR